MFSGPMGYYGYYGTTDGYYTVPVGTTVVPKNGYMFSGTMGYYGYYGTTDGYYVVPVGTT